MTQDTARHTTSRRSWGRPSPLLMLAVVTLLVTAGVHIALAPEHLEEAPYVGVLFLALSVACVGLAAVLVARNKLAEWWTAGAVTLAALVAFILSRTVGLPQLGDDIGNWSDPLGWVAIIAEAVTVLAAASVLQRRSAHSSPTPAS